ncbi:unnamed protein product [Closterium sp. NIES-64]|nr:unnamed protein product [Closterium sp. NIES-64]
MCPFAPTPLSALPPHLPHCPSPPPCVPSFAPTALSALRPQLPLALPALRLQLPLALPPPPFPPFLSHGHPPADITLSFHV